ncbi:MAG TPA: polysaccharide biosynthesis C-terminal domain-containing protein [Puia sp.]|uniref:polysaccharide biosynthesis C-terminal domain-containing protein n=1 Tax=Puia sp. TaxID=2045100 RepID=UPI002BE99C17|nr:polysaccharide biosynthesis C-terminal domain-containing protein [Puia sp.]HVU96494.1 polysaccharide biosynthesis C-terminal domain-containing protein [Puia sp.]
MSTIRRQSIISSGIAYFGIGVGALNTLLAAKGIEPAEYGLYNGLFIALANIMYACANAGMPYYIQKFYPYYHDNLPQKKNDMMTWVLLIGFVGFLLVTGAGLILKPVIIRKFGHNSAAFVHYYYWIFPFALGLTFYSLLEAYGWQVRRSVLTSYLREVQWRLMTCILVVLLLTGVISDFGIFIAIYACTYLVLAVILFVYLIQKGELTLTLVPSRVTRKFFRKILSMALMGWAGSAVFNLSFYFAQVVIAAVVPNGLTYVGVFTLAQYIASLIQTPQKPIIAAATGPLSRAWKDKDLGRIQRIYARSSINQLIFSAGIFLLIWLNFTDGVITLQLKPEYLQARSVFLIIGLTRIIDMGTGVNSSIIGTSNYWQFELVSGLILIVLTLPLNYFLAVRLGVVGPAIADLVTFSVYNFIRWVFLYRKFGLQPFSRQTIYTLVLAVAVYFICHYLFHRQQGFLWLVLRSASVILLYGAGVLALRLSSDILPVWATVKKRLGIN